MLEIAEGLIEVALYARAVEIGFADPHLRVGILLRRCFAIPIQRLRLIEGKAVARPIGISDLRFAEVIAMIGSALEPLQGVSFIGGTAQTRLIGPPQHSLARRIALIGRFSRPEICLGVIGGNPTALIVFRREVLLCDGMAMLGGFFMPADSSVHIVREELRGGFKVRIEQRPRENCAPALPLLAICRRRSNACGSVSA